MINFKEFRFKITTQCISTFTTLSEANKTPATLNLIYLSFRANMINVLRSFNLCDLSQIIHHCDMRNK